MIRNLGDAGVVPPGFRKSAEGQVSAEARVAAPSADTCVQLMKDALESAIQHSHVRLGEVHAPSSTLHALSTPRLRAHTLRPSLLTLLLWCHIRLPRR